MLTPVSTPFKLRSPSSRAFTLIELLVVIVILGILMAVAVPTFLSQQNKAKDSKTEQQLTNAYKAIRSGLAEYNNAYPSTASIVSVIAQSEPELTVTAGSCNASTSDTQVVVDNVTSSAKKLSLYAKSSSGNWWNLAAPAAGAPVFTKLGTCTGPLSTGAVTVGGNEITDAVRASAVQGDGRASDSSYGIWTPTTNLIADGGFENDPVGAQPAGWQKAGSNTDIVANDHVKFGARSLKCTYNNGVGGDSNVCHATTTAAVASGTTYTSSAWVWVPSSYDGDGLYLSPENGGGTFTIISRVTANLALRDQWQQVSTTWSVNAAVIPGIVVRVSAPASSTRPSNGGFVYVDGSQTEATVVPTPYVDTSGSTASRSGGLAQFPTTSLSATQGWYATRVRLNFPSTQTTAINSSARLPIIWWMAAGQSKYIWLFGDVNSLGLQVYNGSAFSTAQPTVTWNSGDIVTLVGYWSPSTVAVSINGGSFTTAALNGSPASGLQTTMNAGSLGTSRWCDCDILWFAAGTGTLSDSDARTINGWGNNDPTTQDFPTAAQAQFAWSADNATYVTGN